MYPLAHPLSDLIREDIFIENSGGSNILSQEDLCGFGGVCLDVSHLHDLKVMNPDSYPAMHSILQNNKIGANHFSAALTMPYTNDKGNLQCSMHVATQNSEFNYLKDFPATFFSEFCAIEVENSLREQLEFKKHIEAIILEKN